MGAAETAETAKTQSAGVQNLDGIDHDGSMAVADQGLGEPGHLAGEPAHLIPDRSAWAVRSAQHPTSGRRWLRDRRQPDVGASGPGSHVATK